MERFSPLTSVPQSREEGGGIRLQAAKFIRIVCVCECVRKTKRHGELVSEVDGGVGAREGESEYLGVLYTWLVSVSQ